MSASPTRNAVICTACEKEIKRGETYFAETRSRERVGRAVKVQVAELVAAYHLACAPEEERRP